MPTVVICRDDEYFDGLVRDHMTSKVSLDSTIEDLEDDRWGEPDYSSHVVGECHRLRKVRLRLFTIENLRIMLGQNIGSRYLVPIALEHLEVEPFVEGDFYPGDLLCNVLSLPRSFWADNPSLRDRAGAVAARALAAINASDCEHGPIVAKAIRKAHGVFALNGKEAV
jgi:hypothetical protein